MSDQEKRLEEVELGISRLAASITRIEGFLKNLPAGAPKTPPAGRWRPPRGQPQDQLKRQGIGDFVNHSPKDGRPRELCNVSLVPWLKARVKQQKDRRSRTVTTLELAFPVERMTERNDWGTIRPNNLDLEAVNTMVNALEGFAGGDGHGTQ